MSLSDFASIGSLVSGLAVLVSLVYLGLQVRQADKTLRASARQMRVAQSTQLLLGLIDPSIMPVFVKGMSGDNDMSLTELVQFSQIVRSILLGAEAYFQNHRDGLIDAKTFDTGTIRPVASAPGFRIAWWSLRGGFAKDFQDFVDGIIRETPLGGPPLTPQSWNAAIAALATAEQEVVTTD